MAGPAAAQTPPPLATGEPAAVTPGVPRSTVVVLDRDALFAGSLFGARAQRDLEAASSDLVAENRRIESELEAEERGLTERREGMDPVAFRVLATGFDDRVTAIREAQDAKARAIAQQGDRAQQLFFEQANTVLVNLAREIGALVILDRRSVIASADQIDITQLARSRIDAVLGEGRPARPPRRPAQSDEPPDGTDASGTPAPPDTDDAPAE